MSSCSSVPSDKTTVCRMVRQVLLRGGEAPNGFTFFTTSAVPLTLVSGLDQDCSLPKLPPNGSYREYDVDPEPTGTNTRNKERVVIDSNSGRGWYTNDHYDNFTEMK